MVSASLIVLSFVYTLLLESLEFSTIRKYQKKVTGWFSIVTVLLSSVILIQTTLSLQKISQKFSLRLLAATSSATLYNCGARRPKHDAVDITIIITTT